MKETEAALQESEALFRNAIGSLQECFALYDADDRLVICNEEFRRLHPKARDIMVPGMYFEDLLRHNIDNGAFPGSEGHEEEYFRERLDRHLNPEGPVIRQWPDGSWRLIKSSKTPDGGLAVTQTDITEVKKVDQLKSEFISIVSHELRTPLTSIQGAIGLLKGGAAGKNTPEVLKLLNIADNNSNRLNNLINDILDIERIETGKMEYKMTAVNLNDLVAETIEANALYGKEYNVEFRLTETISDAMVHGDANRLGQVLSNLLSNAAKFSADSKRVDLSLRQQNGAYRVSVIDYGIGIDTTFRKKIFQKFAQSDATDSRLQGGSGLGLKISRSIIEDHSGTIDFDSNPNEGSTFYFELPLLDQQDHASVTSQGSDSKPHILVCEDEPDIALLLRMLLQNDGYHVDIAHDAAQAKNMLKMKSYDTLTLDINLPDQDGISLIKELHSVAKFKELPIVVVSAKSPDKDGELNGSAVSVVDWVEKPIDENRLKACIKTALKKNTTGIPNILHVEDDSDILQIVSAVIGISAHVVPAQNITDARKHLQQQEFDLVILDLSLPDGSGEVLFPLMKRKDDTLIPVIIFSANEISKCAAKNIEIVLTKTKTTNNQILKSIRSVIKI